MKNRTEAMEMWLASHDGWYLEETPDGIFGKSGDRVKELRFNTVGELEAVQG